MMQKRWNYNRWSEGLGGYSINFELFFAKKTDNFEFGLLIFQIIR